MLPLSAIKLYRYMTYGDSDIDEYDFLHNITKNIPCETEIDGMFQDTIFDHYKITVKTNPGRMTIKINLQEYDSAVKNLLKDNRIFIDNDKLCFPYDTFYNRNKLCRFKKGKGLENIRFATTDDTISIVFPRFSDIDMKIIKTIGKTSIKNPQDKIKEFKGISESVKILQDPNGVTIDKIEAFLNKLSSSMPFPLNITYNETSGFITFPKRPLIFNTCLIEKHSGYYRATIPKLKDYLNIIKSRLADYSKYFEVIEEIKFNKLTITIIPIRNMHNIDIYYDRDICISRNLIKRIIDKSKCRYIFNF